MNEEVKKLQEELAKSAERMAEYRRNGFYEQESAEQANYAEIVEKISELSKEQNQGKNVSQMDNLQSELRKSAERMAEYRRGGFYEQEAAEQANYAKIVEKINDLSKDSNNKEQTKAKKKEKKEWHPELTSEQIEELEAEGINPGDQEYNIYLFNHGIKPDRNTSRNGKQGNDKQKDPVLEKYRNEGFGKNSRGEYFNPWIDEYDPEYDPHNDKTYNPDLNKDEENKENKKGVKNDKSKNSPYNKKLDEYNKMLEIYKEDWETLYELQQQYENGNIEYSEYEEHANYMVERYRFMSNEYNKLMDLYGNGTNEYGNISEEDLNKKLHTLDSTLTISLENVEVTYWDNTCIHLTERNHAQNQH